VENDIRITGFTPKLEKHKIVTGELYGMPIHRYLTTALRAPKLLLNALDDRVDGVRIVVHPQQYTIYLLPLSSPRTLLNGIALLGSLLLILLPLLILGGKQAEKNSPATIVLEHALPLTLSLTVKKAQDSSLLEIGGSSDITYVSVPEAWKRREVWGVPIASVTMDGDGFGFTRWRLPPKGHMAFFAPLSPSSLTLHNPAASHLTIKLTFLDIDQNHTDTRTILIDKESQKVLW